MNPIAVSADRRFHRARVRPGRRRGYLRGMMMPVLKYASAALLAGYATYRGVTAVAGAPVLAIDRIAVHGNQQLPSGDVLAVLNGLRGENLLRTDLDVWRKRVLASPWVRDVTLRRSLPSTIEVTIAEREPIGIGRLNGELYLVDRRGVIIDAYGPQYADFDLPIIDGLSAPSAAAVPDEEARAELAARVIADLRQRPAIGRRLSQVDVSDAHNAAVILDGDPAMIYVGTERFLQRLESYLDLTSALRARVADIDTVDLRFDSRIYVRPGGQTHPGSDAIVSSRAAARGRRDADRQ